jgi:hypothetical protein
MPTSPQSMMINIAIHEFKKLSSIYDVMIIWTLFDYDEIWCEC